jgi:hypothetical protein
MMALAQVADADARATVFTDYLAGKAPNTRRAQRADLDAFSAFLATAGLPQPPTGEALQTSPAAWAGISHGIVKAFGDWQLGQGAALGSIGRRLATVRKYAALAFQAGVLSESAYCQSGGAHSTLLTHTSPVDHRQRLTSAPAGRSCRGYGGSHLRRAPGAHP